MAFQIVLITRIWYNGEIQKNRFSCVSLYTNILRNEYVCFDHMVKDLRGKWYNLCNWCHGLSPSEYYLYLLHNNVLIRRRRRCNKDCLLWVIKVICIEISPLSPNGNQFTFQGKPFVFKKNFACSASNLPWDIRAVSYSHKRIHEISNEISF